MHFDSPLTSRAFLPSQTPEHPFLQPLCYQPFNIHNLFNRHKEFHEYCQDPENGTRMIQVRCPYKWFYGSCRKECGAHITYNACWEVQNLCIQQMLQRDGMHAIDFGLFTALNHAPNSPSLFPHTISRSLMLDFLSP